MNERVFCQTGLRDYYLLVSCESHSFTHLAETIEFVGMKTILFLSLFTLALNAQGQSLLLSENFDYPGGAPLRDHGWYVHSGGTTNPITVTTSGLSLGATPYFGNAVGRAALVNNTGADENRPLSVSRDTGSVYASFLVKTSGEITTDGSGYFFHFVEYSNPSAPVYTAISTAHRARTYITVGSTPANFRLGLTFNSATVPSAVGVDVTNDLDTSKTYLVVVKYTFVSGADNDQVSLFVFENGDTLANEPATATLGPFGGTAADVGQIQGVALRQFNAAQKVIVDGIYVRDNWLLQPDNTSVTSNDFNKGVRIYPNPLTEGPLYISSENNAEMTALLTDIQGKQVLLRTVSNGKIELPPLPQGVYTLQLEQKGQLATKRLIIR